MPKPIKSKLLVFIFFLAVFHQTVYSVPFITLETELAMGKEADTSIITKFGLYQDKPLQIYEDLVFNNEKKAIDKAAELRIDNPGPTRLEETITGSPEERRKVESLELQRKFNLKLAGYRIKD